MLLEIFGFILAIIGFFLVISSYINVEETDFIEGCCGGIPLAIILYFYVTMNNNGKLLILAILYGFYFIKNPGILGSIFGGIGEIIQGILGVIISLFDGSDNKTDEDYKTTYSKENTVKQKEIQKIKGEPKLPKNKELNKNNNNVEKSHYYLDLLDINRGTKEELERVDGITKVTAQKIINLRKEGRYINSFLELTDLLDISYGEQARIIEHIYISDDMKKTKQKTRKNPKKPIKQYENKQDKKDKKPVNNHMNNKQRNQPKNEHKFEKIDINKASYSDINGIPGITSMMASKIIKLRTEGRYIESYEDLKNVLNLSQFQLEQVKDNILITNEFKNINSNNTPDNSEIRYPNKNENKNDKNNSLKPKNQNKIDINQASEEELSQLRGLTVVQAKVIIQLRQSGFPIKSFDDLAQKLNLNNSQIEVIKKEAMIKESERKTGGRIIDL